MEEVRKEKGFTPQSLIDRPKYPGAHSHYLTAFSVLSAGRSIQEFPLPISTEAILAYATLMGIRPGSDRAEELLNFVRLLDSVYLTHWAKKNA